MSLSSGMTLAASASIIASAAAAGAMASFSICAIPAVLKGGASSDVMLKQWWTIYHHGKVVPITALIAALSYGAVSYNQHTKTSPRWRGFALAAAFTVAAIPFTIAFIGPTNSELSAGAHAEARTMSDKRVRSLITKWMNLNYIRLSLPLTGAIVGLWTLLS
ncbi:hypothetical protein TruAng_010414 [Truncatella angustata]|nr:hypothetical protein TruAng_010414 [Truncatella angustata]